jgi:hypothetical protein
MKNRARTPLKKREHAHTSARLDFLHHFVRDRDLGEQVTTNVQVFRRSESKHGPGPPVVVRVT